MRTAIKWLGFILIAIAVAVLPVAIWISGPWWVAALFLGSLGGLLLAIGLAGREIEAGGEDPPA